MQKQNIDISDPSDDKLEKHFDTEVKLLKWIEHIFVVVCFIVLVYTLFFCSSPKKLVWRYDVLITTEIFLVLVAIMFFRIKKYSFSSNLLILAGIIGPWWSAAIDSSVINGNLFPLVYITIPILFTSFFSPIATAVIVGMFQILGLGIFIYSGNFDLNMGASSLFFFVIFIFVISLIFNIQNRNNRRTISTQFEQLKEFANHDPLTGMLNRRFPFEFLHKEFARLKRTKGILSIVIFDVDDFKYFNDTFGHDCGDEILISISKLISGNFRESDVSCRYGGDEFLIAMSGANLEEAKKRVEKLQRLIAEEKYDTLSQEKLTVTISVGIAAYPRHGEDVDEVIKAADQALYLAKERGKNRIEILD